MGRFGTPHFDAEADFLWSATIFSYLDKPRMKKKCYLCGMFVEKKQNKSGSISVRIIQKVVGHAPYRLR
jgi:hypothetical protein